MKITIPKLFELSALPANMQKIEPLVSFINGAVDQFVKALQGRLTLRDNAYSEIRSLVFKRATDPNAPWTQEFTPAQRTVEGVMILQTESVDGNTLASWTYAFQASGKILVTAYPRLMASPSELTIKFAVLFQ